MPYRSAPYWIVGLIGLTVIGFWPGYFSVLSTAPWGFHFHGITATAWLLLLAVQSWSAHARKFALHRALGMASLALFPLFLAGGAAVILSMAAATAAGDPFYRLYGARLATMDLNAVGLVAYLYHKALVDRRRVQLHARWLLATPLPLLPPILARVIGHWTPALTIHGSQDFHLFAWSTRVATLIAVVVTVWFYAGSPRYGRPFAITAAALIVQLVTFDTLGLADWWDATYRALGGLPVVPLLLATILVGAIIEWFGWQAGARRVRTAFNTG